MNDVHNDNLKYYLVKRAKELGFGEKKTKMWVNYMLDTRRGESILKKIGTYNFGLVLDLGCGYGAVTEVISKKFKTISVDIEHDRVKIAKMRSDSIVICADGVHVPFKDNMFDLIILNDILEHLNYTNQFKICNEANRVIKKDGKVMVTVPNRLQLFDDHNDFLIFASIFPDKLRRKFVEKFSKSRYCEVYSHTLFGWINLFHMTNFKLNLNLSNILLFNQNFEFVIKKK